MRDLELYEKSYYENYAFEKYQVAYRRRKILEILDRYQPKKILEVGCGVEPLFNYYENFEAYSIVEPVKSFIELAQLSAKENPNIFFYEGVLESEFPKLKERDFDFIIVSSLIHEVENPVELIRGIRNLCDGSTVVHLNVPNASSLHNLLGKEMGVLSSVFERSNLALTMQRHHTFDLRSLSRFVMENGFEVIDSGSYFLKPLTHRQMKLLLDHEIIDQTVLDAFYAVTAHFPEFGSEIYVNMRVKSQ